MSDCNWEPQCGLRYASWWAFREIFSVPFQYSFLDHSVVVVEVARISPCVREARLGMMQVPCCDYQGRRAFVGLVLCQESCGSFSVCVYLYLTGGVSVWFLTSIFGALFWSESYELSVGAPKYLASWHSVNFFMPSLLTSSHSQPSGRNFHNSTLLLDAIAPPLKRSFCIIIYLVLATNLTNGFVALKNP